MKRFFIIFLVLISSQGIKQEKSILNDCLSAKQVNLLNDMISSFESDVCKYYELSNDKSDEAVLNFLNDFKVNMEDSSEEFFMVLKIASGKSKQLLRESFDVLSDDVWITYEEENNPKRVSNHYEQKTFEKNRKEINITDTEDVSNVNLEDDFGVDDIPILEKDETIKNRLEKDSIAREGMMRKYKNKHYLRIYGKLVDCVSEKTKNESAKKLYNAILASGRISPLLFIDGLISLRSEDFNSKEIRTYIAMDMFYSRLDFELN